MASPLEHAEAISRFYRSDRPRNDLTSQYQLLKKIRGAATHEPTVLDWIPLWDEDLANALTEAAAQGQIPTGVATDLLKVEGWVMWAEALDFIVDGKIVVVATRKHGRGVLSGVKLRADCVEAWKIYSDGPRFVGTFGSTDTALRAARRAVRASTRKSPKPVVMEGLQHS
jgi:hypothetical protein